MIIQCYINYFVYSYTLSRFLERFLINPSIHGLVYHFQNVGNFKREGIFTKTGLDMSQTEWPCSLQLGILCAVIKKSCCSQSVSLTLRQGLAALKWYTVHGHALSWWIRPFLVVFCEKTALEIPNYIFSNGIEIGGDITDKSHFFKSNKLLSLIKLHCL